MSRLALVTGAYGFVGRHVARALAAQDVRVIGIGHGAWGRDEWRRWGIGEWHVADVTTDVLLTYSGEPDVVFHCAGSGSVAFSMTHPWQDFHRTVTTTLSVLEFIRLHHPDARLVMPSSAGVYGVAETLPISIGAPLNPVSPYGLHKKMAEELCVSYGRHFGLRSALVRLFSVYGIGIRKQLLWDACSKMASGNAVFGGSGAETRDWIHVEDAAELLVLAAGAADAGCTVMNGAAGQAVTVRDVVDELAHSFGGVQVRFSGNARPGDPVNYQADISQAARLGWHAKRSWREEMKNYADWFRKGAP